MSDANAPAARRLAEIVTRILYGRTKPEEPQGGLWALASLAESTVRWESRTRHIPAISGNAGYVEPIRNDDAIAAFAAAVRDREETEQPLWAEYAALSARLAAECRAAGYSPDRWQDVAERLARWEQAARHWRPYPDYRVYAPADPDHDETEHRRHRDQRQRELEAADCEARALVESLGYAEQWVGSRAGGPAPDRKRKPKATGPTKAEREYLTALAALNRAASAAEWAAKVGGKATAASARQMKMKLKEKHPDAPPVLEVQGHGYILAEWRDRYPA